MRFSRHRLLGLPALALLIAAAGCSSDDGRPTAAVPRPDTKVTKLCRNLAEALPRTVDGLDRNDPDPRSALTAGWGSPAIILRCGVARPAKMDDPEADGVEVDGVGWLLEKQGDGSFRFTTTLRQAYVEVSLPESRASGGLSPLTDLASALKRTIPPGIAS
ncbi:DUF3515 domain-containing protein [Streptomyces sp. NPDC048664]|uniref:DUF3515 domain-containing protein n=1 Tax=Streptomyces sp. NPDC048664 TaxID=3154505 RepID=UPI00341226F3